MPTVIFPSSEDPALLARAVNKAEPLEPRRSHSLIRRPGKQGGAYWIRGEAGVALQSSSPPGQARRGRTTRTPGAEPLYAAIVRGRCCRLLIALALLLILARADAAEPSLTDYFRAWGIGDDAFAKFSDDRQVTDDELGVIRRIAVRCATARRIGCNLRCRRRHRPSPRSFPRPPRLRAGHRGTGCSRSKVCLGRWSVFRTQLASRCGDAS